MRILQNNKGQAVVEFAIILPIILLILVGIMEFGLLLSHQLIIESASREGARYGVLGASDGEIRTYVGELTDVLDVSKLTVTITPSQAGRSKGIPLTIQILYNHELMIPLLKNIVGNFVNLKASTTMRIE